MKYKLHVNTTHIIEAPDERAAYNRALDIIWHHHPILDQRSQLFTSQECSYNLNFKLPDGTWHHVEIMMEKTDKT